MSKAPAAGHHAPPARDSLADTAFPADRALRRLFATVPFASACPQLAYGIIGYFTALQVQSMNNADKVHNLALVHAAAAAAGLVAQPLVGLLSDRTRSRFGARTPWMVAGLAIGCMSLVGTGFATSIAVLTVTAMAAHFGFNTFACPLTAIQPDRVPPRRRGRYSTLAGLGVITAGVLAPVLGASFLHRISTGYLVAAATILIAALVFLVLNPDRDNRAQSRPPFSLAVVMASLWIDPRRNADFYWVFLGRFLICAGYFMLLNYQLYITEDYIGLGVTQAARVVSLLNLISLPGFILATLVAGPLSDRIGRRKPFVLVGGLLLTLATLVPIAIPTVPGLAASTIILTVGFGTFVSVDQALVTQVLPNPESAAKDLGLINIAATLPAAIAPVAAAAIVTAFGGYAALYPAVAGLTCLGALAVLRIRTVR
ncbi:MFS transporter [Nocardia sp. NPDC052278]|uniref:MFS transporter n=1 Tax=unclassified Nocardia TaxID=2637762 RepID=UPI0036CD9746